MTGPFLVTATLSGAAAPALFDLTNLPAAAQSLLVDALTSPQSTRLNTAFPLPLRVRVRGASTERGRGTRGSGNLRPLMKARLIPFAT